MRALCFSLALASAGGAPADPLIVRPSGCAPLATHVPDADMAYQPGVDAYGRAVPPADLPGSGTPTIEATDVGVAIELPIRQATEPADPSANRFEGFDAIAEIGTMTVDANGVAHLAGRPLGGSRSCRRVARPRPETARRAVSSGPAMLYMVRAAWSGRPPEPVMFSPFVSTIAFRYLRARRQEGFVSVIAAFSLLGIALGVGALIVVMSVMNGFRHELIGRILGFAGHITVVGGAQGIPDYGQLDGLITAVPGVMGSTPVVEGQVLASARSGRNAGVLVRGIAAEDLKARGLINDNIVAGDLAAFGAENGVVIGGRLAGRLGLRVGDPITLISPKGQSTALGNLPRMVAYPVVAVFEVGMYEYDNGVVFMPLAEAQAYFRYPDAVTAIEVSITTPETPEAARRAIEQALPTTVRVVHWQQTNAQFFGALQVERNVMFVILTLIILVAAFNIISSLIMLVKDKGRDIAILRTVGATRGMIMRVFLLTGSTIGVLGTLLGFVLGLAFALNIESLRQVLQRLTGTELFAAEIYFLSRLPARVDWNEVAIVVAMALGLSFLATLYPSWRAARTDPAEALRYE